MAVDDGPKPWGIWPDPEPGFRNGFPAPVKTPDEDEAPKEPDDPAPAPALADAKEPDPEPKPDPLELPVYPPFKNGLFDPSMGRLLKVEPDSAPNAEPDPDPDPCAFCPMEAPDETKPEPEPAPPVPKNGFPPLIFRPT